MLPGGRGSEAEGRSRLGVALEGKGSERGWIEAVLASVLVGVFFLQLPLSLST